VKNVCAVLIFALLLSITPYDYMLSRANLVAHATPEPPDPSLKNQFDVKNSTWTWHHSDNYGGSWAVTNKIDYYDAAGTKASHTIEYAQRGLDSSEVGDTTFSAFNPMKSDNSKSIGAYWFKLDKFDGTDQSSLNIYLYIYTPVGNQTFVPELAFSDTTGNLMTQSFQNVTLPGTPSTWAKKAYGLYLRTRVVNDPISKNDLQRESLNCTQFGEFVLLNDIVGYPKIPYTFVGDWLTFATGNKIQDRFTNTNINGRCMSLIGTPVLNARPLRSAPVGTGLFLTYETQMNDYLKSIPDVVNKPDIVGETLTTQEIAPCKDLVLDNALDAQKDFINGFSKALDIVLQNAVDNTGAEIVIEASKRATLANKVKDAFAGKLDNPDTSKGLVGAIDGITLYQQFYGGYGVPNNPITGYKGMPTAQYPNEYYDTNKRAADKYVLTTLENFTNVKPANSTVNDKSIDMTKTIAKAAKASAGGAGDEKLLASVIQIANKATVGGTVATGLGALFIVVMYKAGLITKGLNTIFGPMINALWIGAQDVILNIGVGLEAFFGTLSLALLQICVILAAVLIGAAVVWWGWNQVAEVWKLAYARAYYSSFYGWWLGTKAADFHQCMLNNSVGKVPSLTAAKAAALGLTATNLNSEQKNLELTRGDLAKESATVADAARDDSCGCGDVTGSNIMSLMKKSFCAVICWTFNVGKGLQENATCLFNSALGTIGRSEDKKPRLSSAACKKP